MWGRAAMSKRRSAPPGKGRGWRSSSSPSQDLRPEIVHLVQQRDAIQTAKLVASIDQVSQGRFLFGVGGGWNQDEMENHGTVYASRSRATPAGQDAGTAEFGSLRKRGALIVTQQIDYSSMCAHSVKYFRL